MGSSIGLYGGNQDTFELIQFSRSIGLHVLPLTIDTMLSDDPSEGPFCFLSLVSKNELHPYGTPPVRIAEVLDPMLMFQRPYFKNPYLVLGGLYWNNDEPKLAEQTKPYYQELGRWIRKEWNKYGDFYIGPEASKLVLSGAIKANTPPDGNTEFEVIKY